MKKSPLDKDSIKFNLIEINLRTANETRQRILDNKLKRFKVRATHLGNSYYRYDKKYYVITCQSHSIEYSFEKDSMGLPVHRNSVYKKIKNGDLMLSPYAMWKIELLKMTSSISFDELTLFENEVDIELVGSGTYVTKGNENLRVERHYEPYDEDEDDLVA